MDRSAEAGSERSASAEAFPHHQEQLHQPAADAEQASTKKRIFAVSSQGLAVVDGDAQCGCSSQSNGLLSGVAISANGNAADHWRHDEARLTSGSQLACCSEQLNLDNALTASPGQLQSRAWQAGGAVESKLLQKLNLGVTPQEQCTSQAGEAMGEYVMYRF